MPRPVALAVKARRGLYEGVGAKASLQAAMSGPKYLGNSSSAAPHRGAAAACRSKLPAYS